MSDQETTLIELAAGLLARGRIDAEEPYGHSAGQRADIIRKSERNADACLAGAEALRLLPLAVAGELCRGGDCQHPDCAAVRALLARCQDGA